MLPLSRGFFSVKRLKVICFLFEIEPTTTSTTTNTTTTSTTTTTTKPFDCYDGNNAGCSHICDQVREIIHKI